MPIATSAGPRWSILRATPRAMRDRHLVQHDRHRRQPAIDCVVVAWMSLGASVSPAPPHASVIATGSALGLMLACPVAEPPFAPFSVNAATGATRVSEIVNLIVPYWKVTIPLPESVSALQEASGVYSVVCQVTGALFS